jgi:hypothetical protein
MNSALPQKSHLARVGCILVGVGSCDFVDRPVFLIKGTNSHELNTKLATTPIDFLRQSEMMHGKGEALVQHFTRAYENAQSAACVVPRYPAALCVWFVAK